MTMICAGDQIVERLGRRLDGEQFAGVSRCRRRSSWSETRALRKPWCHHPSTGFLQLGKEFLRPSMKFETRQSTFQSTKYVSRLGLTKNLERLGANFK